jgi:hypothetical protein
MLPTGHLLAFAPLSFALNRASLAITGRRD